MTQNRLFQIFGFLIAAPLIISTSACKKIVLGCMDPVACNYSDVVTDDNGSCTYPEENFDCTGGCLNDQDGDGVCDENEISGCMDSLACNFDPNATDQLSNSCDYESCLGCTDANAFNYDSSALIDDGSCQSAVSLMLNTWSVIAECSGEFIGSLLPSEITITEGVNDGELMLDLGTDIIIYGTIDVDGNITISNQDIGFDMFSITVSGNGTLESETSAVINVYFSSLLINDDCVLTLGPR